MFALHYGEDARERRVTRTRAKSSVELRTPARARAPNAIIVNL